MPLKVSLRKYWCHGWPIVPNYCGSYLGYCRSTMALYSSDDFEPWKSLLLWKGSTQVDSEFSYLYRYIWPLLYLFRGLTTNDSEKNICWTSWLPAMGHGCHAVSHVDDQPNTRVNGSRGPTWCSRVGLGLLGYSLILFESSNHVSFALPYMLLTSSVLSTTSKQCFGAACNFLVCSLIFIEYKEHL